MKAFLLTTSLALVAQCSGQSTTAQPLPTGLVTVTFTDGTGYVGQIVAANTFQACGSKERVTLSSADTILAGGECQIAYSDDIKLALFRALPGGEKSVSVVNSVAVSADGKTALATYVSGSKTAQAVLTKNNGTWAVAQPSAAVSPATLGRLQSKIHFDVTTPALHVSAQQ